MSARTIVLLVLAAGVGLAAWSLGLFDPPTAHLAALVPGDARYAVVTRSLNDLRRAYEGKYAPQDLDAASTRFGVPVNVPGLDGFDYDRPAGYYAGADGSLVYVVPVTDTGAFEAAHAEARENIHAKKPVQVAKHYLSVSQTDAVAVVGPDDQWILEATGFPLALVGRPDDGIQLKLMLNAFLHEPAPRLRNAVPIGDQIARMPNAVADAMAAELARFRLALPERTEAGGPVRFSLLADAAPTSRLAAGAAHADAVHAGELLGCLPAGNQQQTVLGVAAVLDGAGWRAFGAPFDVGPAAGALGIVSLKFRAGRYALVFALAPTDPARLDALSFAREGAEERAVDDTPILVWKLEEPPAAFASVFRTDAAEPPPLYACSARVNGKLFCAMGAHAEEVLRSVIRGATGARPQRMQNLVTDENRKRVPTHVHEGFFGPGRVALGFIDARAQRALEHPLPYIPMAAIGQPQAVTFTVNAADGRIAADVLCFPADAE